MLIVDVLDPDAVVGGADEQGHAPHRSENTARPCRGEDTLDAFSGEEEMMAVKERYRQGEGISFRMFRGASFVESLLETAHLCIEPQERENSLESSGVFFELD